MLRSTYEIGKQPCENFEPHDSMFYGSGNVHDCYGPLINGEMKRECKRTVSFCVRCTRDHHEGGYESCGKKIE